VPTVARIASPAVVLLCLCCLSGPGIGPGAPPAGAEDAATSSSCVATTTTPIVLPGDSSVAVADTCQSSANALTGGEQVPAAAFARPTKPGDLLAAAVQCGVLKAGMAVPDLVPPAGWDKAKKRTGGIDGGLEVAIYYRPDNPGGITSVKLGQVPVGTDDVSCTTFTWEITGTGERATLDATGSASVVGQTQITVATTRATTGTHDLVLAAESDGSEYPPNQYLVSHHFDLVSVWADGKTYQPGTFSALVTDESRVEKTTVSQTSQWLDSTAVIAALTI
jgi:hypothetical protein